MAYRSIGQESLGIAPLTRASSSLDKLSQLIDWRPIATLLEPLYPATKGEPAWRPLAMFKALLLAVWYDLSDGKLAEALDDRASFRCFCGFSSGEATPERTGFCAIPQGADRAWIGSSAVRDGYRRIEGQGGQGEDGHAGGCHNHCIGERGGRQRALG